MPRRYTPYRGDAQAGKQQRRTRVARWVFALMGLTVAGIIWGASEVLLPFFIGSLIAYVLAPAVSATARRGIPRLVSILLAYIVLFGSTAAFFLYLLPKLQTESRRFARRFQGAPQQVSRAVEQGGDWLEDFFGTTDVEISSQRAEIRRALNLHGLGPDTFTLEAGAAPSLPLLVEKSPHATLSPGSDLTHRLGLRYKERAVAGAPKEEEQIIATIRDDEIGIRLEKSTLEVRQIGEGVFSLAPRAEPANERDLTPERIQAIVRDALNNAMHSVSSGLVGTIVQASQGLASWLSRGMVSLIVTLMVAAFILLDLVEIASFFRRIIPPRQQSYYTELLNRLDRGLSGVVRGQLIICIINGALSAIGFFIFVPEYTVVLAIFATIMTLIPIFGTIISTVPACLLALSSGGWAAGFGVFIWVLVIHFIEANILNPKIIGASARINPVVVVFVLVAGEHFFGLKGALLAVPVTAIVAALGGFIFAHIKPDLFHQ